MCVCVNAGWGGTNRGCGERLAVHGERPQPAVGHEAPGMGFPQGLGFKDVLMIQHTKTLVSFAMPAQHDSVIKCISPQPDMSHGCHDGCAILCYR